MSVCLRVVTWNIHKGVHGAPWRKRLEIHNMREAIARLDADIVFLQEVHRINHREAARFAHWPELPQADFLAPAGYHCAYQTNAYTGYGEHGNALLSRYPIKHVAHEDMSDHRFEQRGLLHVLLEVQHQPLHCIVLHLGLVAASRRRQLAQLARYIEREIPARDGLLIAGDFNAPIAPLIWAQNHLLTVQESALNATEMIAKRPLCTRAPSVRNWRSRRCVATPPFPHGCPSRSSIIFLRAMRV